MTIASGLEHYVGLFVFFGLLLIAGVGSVPQVVQYLMPTLHTPFGVERSLRNAHRMKYLKK